jgi:hypothetical protein
LILGTAKNKIKVKSAKLKGLRLLEAKDLMPTEL